MSFFTSHEQSWTSALCLFYANALLFHTNRNISIDDNNHGSDYIAGQVQVDILYGGTMMSQVGWLITSDRTEIW